jgi:hypothetical protein
MTDSRATTPPENVPSKSPDHPSDHDSRGRFARGNKSGPGNPFARQSAALRQALMSAVTPQDIADVAAKLMEKAKQGDVSAAKLVLSYTLGKPTPAIDPDTLDQQELKTLADNHVSLDDLQCVVQRLPVGMILGLLDAVLPFLDRAKATKFHDLWKALGAEMERKHAQAEEDDDAEANSEAEEEPPSKPQSLEEAVRELQDQREALKAYLNPAPALDESTTRSVPRRQAAKPAGARSAPSTNGCYGGTR